MATATVDIINGGFGGCVDVDTQKESPWQYSIMLWLPRWPYRVCVQRQAGRWKCSRSGHHVSEASSQIATPEKWKKEIPIKRRKGGYTNFWACYAIWYLGMESLTTVMWHVGAEGQSHNSSSVVGCCRPQYCLGFHSVAHQIASFVTLVVILVQHTVPVWQK